MFPRRSIVNPRGYTRIGIARRWWHKTVLHHGVVGSIVKDVKTLRNRRAFEFYYRRGWLCVTCATLWP